MIGTDMRQGLLPFRHLKTKKKRRLLTPDEELNAIRKKLKHFTVEKQARFWLDTGNEYLNSLFGSLESGIPYGKMFELAGFESQGKTAMMKKLAGIAQKDGALVGWMDLEDSWEDEWAEKLGCEALAVYKFRPQLSLIGKEKQPRIPSAQEILEELEAWIIKRGDEDPDQKFFVCIDSIAAMLTEEEAAAGIQDQNMRTKVSLATFLSQFLRRWVSLVANYNVMLFFVNQLRVAPGAWGNPEYTPGGNAIRLYASARVRMRRKSKKILKAGKPVGIKGTMTNWKNKTGAGSREGLKCGYKLYYKGLIKFVEADDITSDGA